MAKPYDYDADMRSLDRTLVEVYGNEVVTHSEMQDRASKQTADAIMYGWINSKDEWDMKWMAVHTALRGDN
jgi:hypothetical protein